MIEGKYQYHLEKDYAWNLRLNDNLDGDLGGDSKRVRDITLVS